MKAYRLLYNDVRLGIQLPTSKKVNKYHWLLDTLQNSFDYYYYDYWYFGIVGSSVGYYL